MTDVKKELNNICEHCKKEKLELNICSCDNLENLIQLLNGVCQELGWSIAFPHSDNGEDSVRGMIVGQEDYINDLIEKYDQKHEIVDNKK